MEFFIFQGSQRIGALVEATLDTDNGAATVSGIWQGDFPYAEITEQTTSFELISKAQIITQAWLTSMEPKSEDPHVVFEGIVLVPK